MILPRHAFRFVVVLALALCALGSANAPLARAAGSSGGASWHLEQPLPPELPNGKKATIPVGLGKIGDIEFWAPNRGLLITAGNPPTVPPGIWVYNGVTWRELATVCGATDGRIAWAGENEFWTVSDGRPGQASTEAPPPLEDNTLCHFAPPPTNPQGPVEVVGSYASLAFLPSSYQAMHAAACDGPEDCWFGGEALPEGQIGAFHLHWNGHSLNAEPGPQGHAVEDIRRFGSHLYESVRVEGTDLTTEAEPATEPSDLHLIEPNGVLPSFVLLFPGVPTYSEGESPLALDALHLSSDEQALWGAANPRPAKESAPGQVTMLRYAEGIWSQVLGPGDDPEGSNPFTKEPDEASLAAALNETVESIAADPPSAGETGESAWLALSSAAATTKGPLAPATVARMTSGGVVAERQTLPTAQEASEGVGPKGAAAKIACPAANDCWLATNQGWLFHLAPEGQRQLPQDTDPVFSSLATNRPKDQGVPQEQPDAPPADDSGLEENPPPVGNPAKETKAEERFATVTLPLLSHIHSRLLHGKTLELSFHLAAKARIRLIAKRHRSVVASTPARVLQAGTRHLQLRLNVDRWPTKLELQTHALAPLPTASTREAGTTTVTTSLAFPNASGSTPPAFSNPLGPLGLRWPSSGLSR
jgi:hypothetical protein